MRFRSLILAGLVALAATLPAVGQVNTVPQVGVTTAFNTQKQTFGASQSYAIAASATDISIMCGSATKLVKVQSVTVSGISSTTAAISLVDIIKRSTAGTASNGPLPTKVPFDANNAAATASLSAYVANPTVGTLVGVVAAKKVFFGVASSVASALPVAFDYSGTNLLAQPITLRSTSQCVAVNMGGTASNATVDVSWVWTEE